MDYRIENGTILDGSGREAFKADIEIQNGHITAILPPSRRGVQQSGSPGLKSLSEAAHMRRIDAAGCYVSPGFIDAHSHADLGSFMPNKMELKLRQGVTTEVVGQCGFSPAPMPAERQGGWLKYYVPGSPLAKWQWESTAEFYTALRTRGLPLNLMPFVGHGTLRFAIKGDSSAAMEPSELDRMEALLEEAFDEGAAGLSFGLIYVPALFADRAELRRAAEVAARHRRLLSVHMRSESDELIEALEEMAELQSETGVRLHISHLKAIGMRNQHKIDRALELIEAHSLSFDSYPYTYGSTSLLSMLPPQLFSGASVEDGLARLSDKQVRQEIISLLNGESPAPAGLPWDNLALLLGWDMIELVFIPEGPDACLTGSSLASGALERGTSPAELTLQLCRSYGGQIRIIDVFSEEATVRKILSHPSGIVSTDTLLGGHQHPRVAGSFPRVLSHYTCEHAGGPLTLEAAVHRMSGRSAQFLGLVDRGLLSPGMAADIAVWRPDFIDRSSREAPEEPARGLQYLLINGELVIDAAEPERLSEKLPRVSTDKAGRLLTAPDFIRPQTA